MARTQRMMKTNLSAVLTIALSAIVLLSGTKASQAATEPQPKADGSVPQFFYIRGQVTIPGRRFYTNGVTLGMAMKMAKGITRQGTTKAVLIRNGQEIMTVDWKAIQQGKAKDVELRPNDSVYVPSKKDAKPAPR